MTRVLLSEYNGQSEDKTARVYDTPDGYEVDLELNGKPVKTVMLHEKSVHYANDTAENWTTGVLK